MANHQSAIKRIRQAEKRNVENRYKARTTRNAIKELRSTKEKEAAEKLFPKVTALVDKLAKSKVIHKNKAANLKSGLAKHVSSL